MAEENRETQLDKLERQVWRAVPADEETIDKIAASPFLYAKIRARVTEAQAMPFTATSYRSLLMLLARRAIPALALIAVLAVVSFLFVDRNEPSTNTFAMNEAIFIKQQKSNTPPTACNIANRSECVVSTDDVVAILVHTPESGNR